MSKVTDAQEYQSKMRVNNGQPIDNRDTYVKNLINAKNNVTEAEEALATHKAKIDFLKGELEALEAEA